MTEETKGGESEKDKDKERRRQRKWREESWKMTKKQREDDRRSGGRKVGKR